jgi:predicted transcriptional regulator
LPKPARVKTAEERLEAIEYLLAGMLLRRKPNVNEVAKILGIAPSKLVKLFPERKKPKERAS